MLHRRDWLKGILGVVPAGALLGESWPQFRGAGARGIASDNPRLPNSWSSSENVLWKTDIPGKGWSSPVVWDDQIFLNTNVSASGQAIPPGGLYDGRVVNPIEQVEHRWVVYSIDLNTGKTRWTKEVHKSIPEVPRHRKNSYASETNVTDGERLYVHFGDLATYCLEMSGKLLWTKQWPPVETRYSYGTASSPALHEGRLYIVNDNEDESYVLALDKLTGQEIWKTSREETTSWATPFIWRNQQRTEIITAGRQKVSSYDLDGKLLWELKGMSPLSIPTPFSENGLLYVTSGYVGSEVRPVYAIRPGASGDITLASGETSNRHVAWSLPQGGPYHPSPVVYDGRYYTLLDRGFLTCHDANTGEEIYGKQRIEVGIGGFTSSPWAYNGRVFCLSENGDTYVIEAGSDFKVLGKNSLGEMCMATPAIADSSLILRTYSQLYRIGGNS